MPNLKPLRGLPVLALLAASSVSSEPAPWEKEVRELLDGVKAIAAPGSPGTVAAWGERAFPVVVGGAGEGIAAPVVAAGTMGRGRVMALAHSGYAGAEALAHEGTARFAANAVRWLARGARAPRVGLRRADAAAWAAARGFPATDLSGERWTASLRATDVLLLGESDLAPAEIEAVARFVHDGGGLWVACTGWGWLQLHPGKTTFDNPLNVLLAPAGLAFTADFAAETEGDGYAARDIPGTLVHGARALDALAAGAPEDGLRQAASSAIAAARGLPSDEAKIRRRIAALLDGRAAHLAPSGESPLREDRALDRFLLAWQVEEALSLPAEQVKAHAAAQRFPGKVPGAARAVEREVEIDAAVPDWHSTGLYAAPGATIVVTAPAGLAGWSVRIGCHTDRLHHLPEWPRAPEITREFPLAEGRTAAVCAFGGPVYVVVPHGATGRPRLRIAGAVEAPFFRLGTTKPADWAEIRRRPAPWAELATSKVVLSVPSACVRSLDDPEALLRFWDAILDGAADLAARPRVRERPERYVADVKISAGYMHSGYPIMTHLDAAPRMASLEAMKAGDWGLVHELGHNHQEGDWTFEGTGEVTNNLWSLYLLESVCAIPLDRGHEALRDWRALARAHVAAGADFDVWKREPFLALTTYMHLQETFGWETFRRVFAEYRALPAGERPRTDEAKRDQWMVRFSRAAGRNLGPYFERWGIPTSQAARASVAELPGWMPEGWEDRR